jgi:hypothetical protein
VDENDFAAAFCRVGLASQFPVSTRWIKPLKTRTTGLASDLQLKAA